MKITIAIVLILISNISCAGNKKKNCDLNEMAENQNKEVLLADTLHFLKENVIAKDDETYCSEDLNIYYRYNVSKDKDELFLEYNNSSYKYTTPFMIEIELEVYVYKYKDSYILMPSDIDYYWEGHNFLFYKEGKLLYLGSTSFYVSEDDREKANYSEPICFDIFQVDDTLYINIFNNNKLIERKVFSLKDATPLDGIVN